MYECVDFWINGRMGLKYYLINTKGAEKVRFLRLRGIKHEIFNALGRRGVTSETFSDQYRDELHRVLVVDFLQHLVKATQGHTSARRHGSVCGKEYSSSVSGTLKYVEYSSGTTNLFQITPVLILCKNALHGGWRPSSAITAPISICPCSGNSSSNAPWFCRSLAYHPKCALMNFVFGCFWKRYLCSVITCSKL